MVRAVRPLRSLSMARGCARIDSRLDTVKISLAGRVEVHHARFLAVIGGRKTFPHGLGQKAKYSLGVDVFRFTPESNNSDMAACPKSAMCGRLRVGKDFLHVLQHWSVQPCVRPFNAVHMTAGHNALRGSGPGQNPAFDYALALVGCPDRRIDRLCITC